MWHAELKGLQGFGERIWICCVSGCLWGCEESLHTPCQFSPKKVAWNDEIWVFRANKQRLQKKYTLQLKLGSHLMQELVSSVVFTAPAFQKFLSKTGWILMKAGNSARIIQSIDQNKLLGRRTQEISSWLCPVTDPAWCHPAPELPSSSAISPEKSFCYFQALSHSLMFFSKFISCVPSSLTVFINFSKQTIIVTRICQLFPRMFAHFAALNISF